jgi:hypothetical protein
VQVVEVYRGAPAGTEIFIPFRRVADPLQRARLVFDQWNNLNLEAGSHLLLAAKPIEERTFDALAAENVDSETAAEATELHEAVRIHDGLKPEGNEQLLREALIRGRNLLRRYVLQGITNHALVDRLPAIQMLRAATDVHMTSDERLDFGRYALEPSLFQEERHADRGNREIVALLVNGLVQDAGQPNDLTWIQFMGSLLLRSFSGKPAEDKAVKLSLVRAVDRNQWEKARQILVERSEQGAQDQRELTKDVLQVWLLAR